MLLAIVLGASTACGGEQPSSNEISTAAAPAPESLFLDKLNDHGIKLRSSSSPTGYRDDESTVEYGRGLCDLVSRKGSTYDPIPALRLDDKELSEESARIFYNAARESYCPDVAPYEPTATPVATPDTIPGEGDFKVGSQVTPGTYFSEPLRSGGICAWARASDDSRSSESVIDQGTSEGPVYVTIEPTDAEFSTILCQTWQRVS